MDIGENKGEVETREAIETVTAEAVASTGSGLVAASEVLPPNLFLLPVSQTTLFPGMVLPLILPEGKLTKAVEFVTEGSGYLGVILVSGASEKPVATAPLSTIQGVLGKEEDPRPEKPTQQEEAHSEYLRYGVAAKILKKINLPDNQVSVLLAGLQRFELKRVVSTEPYDVGNVSYLHDELRRDIELEALMRSALQQFKTISRDNPLISEEVKVALVNVDGPGKLADFMSSVLIRDVADYQRLLSLTSVKERLLVLLQILKREQDLQTVQKKIQDQINEKVTSAQKEFYLNEQLKSIQKELGRFNDDKSKTANRFHERLKGKTLKPEVETRIQEELEKHLTLNEQSSEYSVSTNYLDWLTSLPWGVRTQDSLNLKQSENILNEDHYGLKEVKNRILEFLAVRKLRGSSPAEGVSSILCLVGPPGTGKTSLGRSIARALGRKFFRFSVGGMRDEAEIKGHRRTYVGAMPGKILQGLKRVGSQNPVFLLDEIDKIATGWASGGDPASALLEVLDPEQNSEFLDHYLDVPFDLSDVLFITTANTLDTIPRPLLDRLEVIQLHGYTDREKVDIAKRHLIPKLQKKNALADAGIELSTPVLNHIVSRYARESGVRNLEKQLDRIFRKLALRFARGGAGKKVPAVKESQLPAFLGQPPFDIDERKNSQPPGVVTGLAWTSYGGEVLRVEAVTVPGRQGLTLTGTLGQVMQESASLAYTLVRQKTSRLGLDPRFFEKNQIHLHVPAGATPKDGPSAGVTMVTALLSLLSKKSVPTDIAMTGEVTLSGRVLPVGGIREKLLAAKRAGVTRIFIPKANMRDLKEVDKEVKQGLTITPVSRISDLVLHVFGRGFLT